MGYSGISRTSPRGGFYINPSRRGPVPHFWDFWRGSPGGAQNGYFGQFSWKSREMRDLGSPDPEDPDHPGRAQGPGARG